MKKVVLPVLLLSLIAVSCGNKSAGSNSGNSDDTTSTEQTSQVFEVEKYTVEEKEKNCDGDNCAYMKLEYEYIKGGDPEDENSVIAKVNGEAESLMHGFITNEAGVDESLLMDPSACAMSFIESYQEFKEMDDMGGAWTADFTQTITHPFEEIYTITTSSWVYAGGAHGNGALTYTTISSANGKKLTLKDVFTDLNKLTEIAESYFRKQNMEDPEMDLTDAGYEFGEEGFSLNENFSLTSKGVIFSYNSYEIGPYSMPPSDIDIPMEKIKPLLKIKLTDTK